MKMKLCSSCHDLFMFLIPCLWLCFAQIYVRICFLSCFMLRSASIHAYMLGFMFFHVYVLAFTCSHMHCHAYAQIYIFTCLRARIQVFTCLYVQIYVLTCLCVQISALPPYVQISTSMCLDLCSTSMLICPNLCSYIPICPDLQLSHLPCARVLRAMFLCLYLGYVCLATCYCSPSIALPFFLVFWTCGQNLIYTLWSLSSSIYLGLYQKVWITRLHVYACLLLCFIFHASLSSSWLCYA